MKHAEIIRLVGKELTRSKEKYPDDKWPWSNFNKWDFPIFEAVSLVHIEAGEAIQAMFEVVSLVHMKAGKAAHDAEKYHFSRNKTIEEVKDELIQTISTAIRVLEKL